MTARAWTLIPLAALLACGGAPTAPEIDPLEARKAAMRAFLLEAEFFYGDGECAYRPAGATELRDFVCGRVVVGFLEGVTDAEVAGIVASMGGGFFERVGSDPWSHVEVDVPVTTEREGCLVALADPRVRYCSVIVNPPVSLN